MRELLCCRDSGNEYEPRLVVGNVLLGWGFGDRDILNRLIRSLVNNLQKRKNHVREKPITALLISDYVISRPFPLFLSFSCEIANLSRSTFFLLPKTFISSFLRCPKILVLFQFSVLP